MQKDLLKCPRFLKTNPYAETQRWPFRSTFLSATRGIVTGSLMKVALITITGHGCGFDWNLSLPSNFVITCLLSKMRICCHLPFALVSSALTTSRNTTNSKIQYKLSHKLFLKGFLVLLEEHGVETGERSVLTTSTYAE